jgi:hypothetical protein
MRTARNESSHSAYASGMNEWMNVSYICGCLVLAIWHPEFWCGSWIFGQVAHSCLHFRPSCRVPLHVGHFIIWHSYPGYGIWYDVIWYDIYLFTAIGLTPGRSSTLQIYTQTVHRTTHWNRIHTWQ